jgi:hypothetical protein
LASMPTHAAARATRQGERPTTAPVVAAPT